MKITSIVAAACFSVAACGGGGGNVASLAPLDHVSAVRGFMNAVGDENVTNMAGLWGTEDGLAADRMNQDELVQRLSVIMAYLAHDRYELTDGTDALVSTADVRQVTVRMSRGSCESDVPFTVVRSGGGWLVKSMDLEAAVSPSRRCDGR